MTATTASSNLNHKKGIGIAALGGTMLACDIPMVRLAETDPWTTLAMRGPIMFTILLIVAIVLQRMGLSRVRFYEGRDTLILGMMHAIATLGFVLGIFHTTTANLVFITAFSSLIALLFATLFLGERHPKQTWAVVIVALCGVSIITIGDALAYGTQNLFGNMMALLCAFMLALEVIFIRRSSRNLVYAPAFAGIFAALFALPFMMLKGPVLGAPEFLILNSVLVAPLAMALMTLAPRFIPAPEAAMFYLLETVLAPLLVWIIFLEVPSPNTLLGGAIIILAISFHSVSRIRGSARQVVIRPSPPL